MTKPDLRHLLQPNINKSPYSSAAVPPLVPILSKCRILKFQHNRVACGLCGKIYENEEYAWICVAACSAAAFANANVASTIFTEQARHHCPACGKLFPNRADAVACLARCHYNLVQSLPGDALKLAIVSVPGTSPEILQGKELSDSKIGVLQKPAEKVVKPLAEQTPFQEVYVPPLLSTKPVHKIAKEVAPIDVSDNDDLPDLPDFCNDAPNKNDNTSADIDVDVIKRKPGQTSFTRDGAKYICTACQTRYFTRTEVESCFMAHPLEGEEV